MGISEENQVKMLANRAFLGSGWAVIPCFRFFQQAVITQFRHPSAFQGSLETNGTKLAYIQPPEYN
jgi:hypothetical protein